MSAIFVAELHKSGLVVRLVTESTGSMPLARTLAAAKIQFLIPQGPAGRLATWLSLGLRAVVGGRVRIAVLGAGALPQLAASAARHAVIALRV